MTSKVIIGRKESARAIAKRIGANVTDLERRTKVIVDVLTKKRSEFKDK